MVEVRIKGIEEPQTTTILVIQLLTEWGNFPPYDLEIFKQANKAAAEIAESYARDPDDKPDPSE